MCECMCLCLCLSMRVCVYVLEFACDICVGGTEMRITLTRMFVSRGMRIPGGTI